MWFLLWFLLWLTPSLSSHLELALLLFPAHQGLGKLLPFAEERGEWFSSSSGAPARVAAASLVSTEPVGREMCCAGLLLLLLSLWPCCWDRWVPLGGECGGPVRALGPRAWPRWVSRKAFPVLCQFFLTVVYPLRKFLVIVPGIPHLWEQGHKRCSCPDTAPSLAPALKCLLVVLSPHWPLSPAPSILCLGWE